MPTRWRIIPLGEVEAVLLSEVRIKGYRAISDVMIPLDDFTVIVGPNNVGKSAFLDAIRMALPRRGASRSRGLSEYDFHASENGHDPRKGAKIEIELSFKERSPKDWPQGVIEALHEIIQLEPTRNLQSIRLVARASYQPTTKEFGTEWEFLELGGKAVRTSMSMVASLAQYAPLFHLAALRDASDEFGSRSQFWGALLRNVDLPEDVFTALRTKLQEINQTLIDGDPSLKKVTEALREMKTVLHHSGDQEARIEPLPVQPWDVFAKSQITMQAGGDAVSFPLERHGQGVQSMAVLFLFQAFVDRLLELLFVKHSTPILTLEEPEAHLHPQAARSLFRKIRALPGQKIVTTHSPYFVQNVPLVNLRFFRREDASIRAFWIKRAFTVAVPDNPALQGFLGSRSPLYSYEKSSTSLTINGRVSVKDYRKLLACYPAQSAVHAKLRGLAEDSKAYLSPGDLSDLEDFAQRTRGEIFFARFWLLCEGQTEYRLLHFFAEANGTPLDSQGCAVIDYKNNGSAGAFAALARALGFPWFMLCDGDQGGVDSLAELKKRGFELDPTPSGPVHRLPAGEDIEGYLAKHLDLRSVAEAYEALGPTPSSDSVAAVLRKNKRSWAADAIAHWKGTSTTPTTPPILKGLLAAAAGLS